MKHTNTILDRIMVDVRAEVAEAKRHRPVAELQRRLADAPPARSMADALRSGFGLIAEIKERSPSQGPMRSGNVAAAPAAYEHSTIVRGLSVLTNATHFGMSIERLAAVRAAVSKPILRKDFIHDDYQVIEARAFGADAILLMANLLDAAELQRLFDLAGSLGLDVLFECHDAAQIQAVPAGAVLYGINSRTFSSDAALYETSRQHRAAGGKEDLTTDLRQFDLVSHLPVGAIKVAESGVSAGTVARLRDALGYHAALVGTSLLLSKEGAAAELKSFEAALIAPRA